MIEKTIAVLLVCMSVCARVWAQQDTVTTNPLASYYTPENILRFGNYLKQRGDYQRAAAEYQRYLFSGATAERHRVFYQMGECYLKAQQPGVALRYFRQAAQESPGPAFGDSAAVAFATSLLLAERHEAFLQAVDSLNSTIKLPPLQTRLLALQGVYYLEYQQWQKAAEILSAAPRDDPSLLPLADLANRGMNQPLKSRFLAGLLSTLVPGSGKIYAGRVWDGLYSLLLIAGTSRLAYEGFHDHGRSSFKGWLFGSLATFFYAGNIYGSMVAVKFHNERIKKRIANEVEAQLTLLVHF